MKHKDGHWVWVQDRGQVVERDRNGAPLHMSGTLSDISDRKAAEAEIQAMNAALKKSNEKTQVLAAAAMQATIAKSDFLANMSHEIRTPLTAIIGFSDLIRKSQLDQKQRQFIDTVLSSGQLLLSIIEDILDYSKIGSGSIELESLDVDLRRMAAEMIRMFELRVDSSRVRISAEVAPDVPATFRGDPTRLRQVLLNLLSNAVKFTEKGEIILGVARVEGRGGDPLLRFSVRDSGIGIPRERQEGIFSAFEQVDMSTTRKYGGTGLGLAISLSLARLMGGDIAVESEPGRGSTFTFTVPEKRSRGEVATAREERAGEVPADPIKGLRVLVAEDVETNRMLLGFMLSDLGCSVEFAHDGLEALEALRRGAFDICLMDIQMPVMGGIEASKLAKAEGIGVPIIAVTAAASLMDEEACREAGMEGFVTKPLDKRALAAAILAAFDHGSR
ncbi:MAG: ATP-binding protein, partial [Spirochaetota bacterium]